MAIEKMRLVNIISDVNNLDDVLSKFCTLEDFHPEPASKFIGTVKGITTFEGSNPYEPLLQKIEDLSNLMGIKLDSSKCTDKTINSSDVSKYLNEKEDKFNLIVNTKEDIEQVIQEDNDVIRQMNNLEDLGISLDEIFACRYLQVRFGRLPLESLSKLEYYSNKPFVFKSFNEDEAYSWCMYVTTPKYDKEVDNIFSSLYFERIRIPDFVHGTPTKARENMYKDIEENEKMLDQIKDREKTFLSTCIAEFNDLYGALQKYNAMYEARKYVVRLGERFSITGFASEADVKQVRDTFKDMSNVEVEDLPANSDQRLTPPTKLKNGWLTRPFSFFVEMYSLPNYDDFDPTPFFGITYMLLFGAMFGDLGQGLVLCIVGFICAKKFKMRLGDIGVRVGLSSMLFGLIYGSVFGFEHALNPFYKLVLGVNGKLVDVMAPSVTMKLLISTVVLGVLLIVCVLGLNIWTKFKHHQYIEAICSQNGIAGFVFYASVIAMVIVPGLMNPLFISLAIVLPFILIFMKEAIISKKKEKVFFPEKPGAYIVENFFECFEILLTFLANTMSFLRIGGFVLAHTGMMMVVMTIAEMVNPIAGIIVIVFGNILVMGLEGLIVGIQSLRLEFYEMFSRYYDGQGKEFKSLKSQLNY